MVLKRVINTWKMDVHRSKYPKINNFLTVTILNLQEINLTNLFFDLSLTHIFVRTYQPCSPITYKPMILLTTKIYIVSSREAVAFNTTREAIFEKININLKWYFPRYYSTKSNQIKKLRERDKGFLI